MKSTTTLEKVKGLLKNPKAWLFIVPIVLILFCCICFFVMAEIGANLPPSFNIYNPSSNTSWTTEEPSTKVSFTCGGVTSITINDQLLNEAEFNSICSPGGHSLALEGGENKFRLVAQTNEEGSITVDLNVNFDKATYDARIAEQQRIEAERKQQEAEQARLKLAEFKQDYLKAREAIDKDFIKSGEMIKYLSVDRNPYDLRQTAQYYKQYFDGNCRNHMSLIKSEEGDIPTEPNKDLKEAVYNLKVGYGELCTYNSVIADAAIKFAEAGSTKEQFNSLDQVTEYIPLVADVKKRMTIEIYLIDRTVK